MTADEDLLTAELNRLMDRSGRLQGLLQAVTARADAGFYDAMEDIHLIRLPGTLVRAARQLLDAERPSE